jgi:cytohesin
MDSEIIKAVRYDMINATRLLLDHGANLNARDRDGNTLLHIATGRDNILEMLLDRGANADATGDRKRTPLHIAVDFSEAGSVNILLEHGANVNARDNMDITPLHFAARKKNVDISKLLLDRKANVEARDRHGNTPLFDYFCVGVGSDRATGGCDRNTEIFKALVKAGANVNARDKLGNTPLKAVVKKNKFEDVWQLLQAGADPNIANNKNEPPLYTALRRGNIDMIKALLRAGAKINVITDDGEILFNMLVAVYKVDIDSINLALAAGADPNLSGKSGELPLSLALRRKNIDMIKALLRAGAKMNAFTEFGEPLLNAMVGIRGIDIDTIKAAIATGVDLTLTDSEGYDSLHVAMVRKRVDIARELFRFGVDPNRFDTVIYDVEPVGGPFDTTTEPFRKLMELLIVAGASLYTNYKGGGLSRFGLNKISGTALYLAIDVENPYAVRLLLAAGAPLDVRNDDGRTPLEGLKQLQAQWTDEKAALRTELDQLRAEWQASLPGRRIKSARKGVSDAPMASMMEMLQLHAPDAHAAFADE